MLEILQHPGFRLAASLLTAGLLAACQSFPGDSALQSRAKLTYEGVSVVYNGKPMSRLELRECCDYVVQEIERFLDELHAQELFYRHADERPRSVASTSIEFSFQIQETDLTPSYGPDATFSDFLKYFILSAIPGGRAAANRTIVRKRQQQSLVDLRLIRGDGEETLANSVQEYSEYYSYKLNNGDDDSTAEADADLEARRRALSLALTDLRYRVVARLSWFGISEGTPISGRDVGGEDYPWESTRGRPWKW